MTHTMNWQRSAARLLVVVVVLMTVTGAFVPAVAATADGPPQPPQRYFGTVADSGGSPVGGLLVEVTQGGEVVAADVTDSDGYYDLTVNTSDVNTDEQVAISVQEQTKSRDVSSGGSTEVDFEVGATDTVAGGSDELDGGSATVPLSGGDLSEVAVDLGSGASGTVAVRESSSPTGNAPDVSGKSVAVYLDISVSGDAAGQGGTVEVTVSESALDAAGIAPADANLLHYEDGSWETLDTSVFGPASGDVTLSADVDGFSPFAIAGSSDGDGDGGNDGGQDTTTPPTTQSNTGGNNGGNNNGNTGGNTGGGSDTTTAVPTTDDPATQPPTTDVPATDDSTTQPPTSTVDQTTQPPSSTTSDPGTTTSPPSGEEGGPGMLFVGGLIAVLLAVAGALYMVYGRE